MQINETKTKYIQYIPRKFLLEIFENCFGTDYETLKLTNTADGVLMSAQTPTNHCLAEVLFSDFDVKITKILKEVPPPEDRLNIEYQSLLNFLIQEVGFFEGKDYWGDWNEAHKAEFEMLDEEEKLMQIND